MSEVLSSINDKKAVESFRVWNHTAIGNIKQVNLNKQAVRKAMN